jgi:hypothetical protein
MSKNHRYLIYSFQRDGEQRTSREENFQLQVLPRQRKQRTNKLQGPNVAEKFMGIDGS